MVVAAQKKTNLGLGFYTVVQFGIENAGGACMLEKRSYLYHWKTSFYAPLGVVSN